MCDIMKIHTQSMHTYIENNPLPPLHTTHTHTHTPKQLRKLKCKRFAIIILNWGFIQATVYKLLVKCTHWYCDSINNYSLKLKTAECVCILSVSAIFACTCMFMHVWGTEVGTKVIYRIFGVDNDYLQSTQSHIFLGIAISRANKSKVRI